MNDIEILECLRNMHINDNYKGKSVSVALTMAIQALQEKANREKACVDCKYLKTTTEEELPCRDCERRYEDFYKPKEATND